MGKIFVSTRHLHIYRLRIYCWIRWHSPIHWVVIHRRVGIGYIWAWIVDSGIWSWYLRVSQRWRIIHVVERIERIDCLLHYFRFSYRILWCSYWNIHNLTNNLWHENLDICWYTSVFLIKKIIFQFNPSLN